MADAPDDDGANVQSGAAMGFGSGYDPGNVNVGGAYDAATASGLGAGVGLTDPIDHPGWGGGVGYNSTGATIGRMAGMAAFGVPGMIAGWGIGAVAPSVASMVRDAMMPGVSVGPAHASNAGIFGSGAPAVNPMGAGQAVSLLAGGPPAGVPLQGLEPALQTWALQNAMPPVSLLRG